MCNNVIIMTNNRRNEDGIRWTEAIESLKEATAQLKALGEGEGGNAITEDAISEDPAAFFAKVRLAAQLCDTHHQTYPLTPATNHTIRHICTFNLL